MESPLIVTTGRVGVRTQQIMLAWSMLSETDRETERPTWIKATVVAVLADGCSYTVHEEKTVLVFGSQI